MGKGLELAREHAPEHAAVMDELKEQLLIVFLKRLGRKVTIPLAEMDDTGGELFLFGVDEHKNFHFELRKKQ